jgi:ADP-heptose:LPS heptosyltransferase
VQIVITRFSALGDVVIAVPVVREMVIQNPEHHFYMVSMPMVAPLFRDLSNLTFIAFDKKGRHKGLIGIWKFFEELQHLNIDGIVDLHDVLRTKILRTLFRITGKKVAVIDKGRQSKKLLIKKGYQNTTPLIPTAERYKAAFEIFGLNKVDLRNYVFSITSKQTDRELYKLFGEKQGKWIGIAPFAQHKGKQLPIITLEKVIDYFSQQEDTTLFLFGAGKTEGMQLQTWEHCYTHVISIANRFEIDEEVLLMKRLDIMLTMDSANMHLASLVAVPVLSIWGATHPYAGFYGLNQSKDSIVERDLACRPCSIYGNKSCRFGTYECLTGIDAKHIISQMEAMMKSQRKIS